MPGCWAAVAEAKLIAGPAKNETKDSETHLVTLHLPLFAGGAPASGGATASDAVPAVEPASSGAAGPGEADDEDYETAFD